MSEHKQPWEKEPLSNIFYIGREQVFPSRQPKATFTHYSIPAWDKFSGPSIELGEAIESNKTSISGPSVLVSKLNPRKPRVAVIEVPEKRTCCSTEFICYQPQRVGENLRFWGAYLYSQEFSARLTRIAIGSTNSHTRASPRETLGWLVPSVPHAEQEVIAQILETLDTAIRGTEVLIDKFKGIKQGLLHDLLTRGIYPNGQLRPPQSTAPELYKKSPLGWIAREWEVDLLGNLAESLIDGPFGSNLKTAHYVENPGVRVVRLQNIQQEGYDDSDRAFISEKHAVSLSRNQVFGGDVLIASLGDDNYPVGRACYYPPDLPDAVNKADCFRFRSDFRCHNEFITLFMNSALVRRQVREYEQGVTMKRINLGNLRRILVALPELAEQERIVERMRVLQGHIDIAKLQYGKLQQQKSGLMDDLLTGRVRVTPLLESMQQASALSEV